MSKPNSKWYTLVKYKYNHTTHTYDIIHGKDETLFAKGIYPTKVKLEDLPESYIRLWDRRRDMFLDAANITDIVYKPNWFSDNHLYRDDTIYIKYNGKLEAKKDNFGFESYWESADQWVSGKQINAFVSAVQKYSHIDVAQIQQNLQEKKVWYVRNNPTHPELSNAEIPFAIPAHFIYRIDIADRFPLEQQEQLLDNFCMQYKLVPVHTNFVLQDAQDISRLKQEILDYKKNNELAIILILHVRPLEGEQQLINDIWSALHYNDICVEDVTIWETMNTNDIRTL